MSMNSKTYDILKFIAQIILPALGTLYFALAGIWGFPYGEQIVGTIAAIDAFLGALLGISSAQYYKQGKDMDGTLMIDSGDGEVEKWLFQMNPEKTLEEIAGKTVVKLKVDSNADLSNEEAYEAKH